MLAIHTTFSWLFYNTKTRGRFTMWAEVIKNTRETSKQTRGGSQAVGIVEEVSLRRVLEVARDEAFRMSGGGERVPEGGGGTLKARLLYVRSLVRAEGTEGLLGEGKGFDGDPVE